MYDVIYFTGLSQAADNSKNCRITAMTATTFTVAPVSGTALTDMTAPTRRAPSSDRRS
jgi:hypothetical protein